MEPGVLFVLIMEAMVWSIIFGVHCIEVPIEANIPVLTWSKIEILVLK